MCTLPPTDPIHIALCLDQGYWLHTMAFIESAICNIDPQRPLHFHIVGQEIPAHEVQRLRDYLATRREHLYCSYYEATPRMRSTFAMRNTTNHITLPTYYRFFLAELLPPEVHRVFYIDSDTLILQDLSPFYDIDLTDTAIAAVEAQGISREEEHFTQVMHYPCSKGFCSAGAFLANLDYWREHQVLQAFINYYQQHQDRIKYDDQDILNGVLVGKIKYVSHTWNAQEVFYQRDRQPLYRLYPDQPETWRKRPAVVHFMGGCKPWNGYSLHPLRHEYFRYLHRTPWRSQSARYTLRYYWQLLKLNLNLLLGRMHSEFLRYNEL